MQKVAKDIQGLTKRGMAKMLAAYQRLNDLSAQLKFAFDADDHREARRILQEMDKEAANLGSARADFSAAYEEHVIAWAR